MMDPRLELELSALAERIRRVNLNWGLSVCWFAAAVIAGISILIGLVTGWDARVPAIGAAIASLAAAFAVYWFTRAQARNLVAAARRVESRYPNLDHRLLTAMEESTRQRNELGYLQQVVIREAVEHSIRYDWRDAESLSRVLRARLLQCFALMLMWTVLVLAWQTGPEGILSGAMADQRRGHNFRVTVEPGDTSIERGTDLLVLARFSGPLPADVHVSCTSQSAPRRIALQRSLNDPLFGGRVTAVATDMTYHVEFDGERSADYRVTVFDHPSVNQIDAELVYPSYTGLETRRIEDTRHISAVEGTDVTLIGKLNKPVARAWLSDGSGSELDFSLSADDPLQCRVTLNLQTTQRYTMHLLDSDGRPNKFAPDLTLTAIPDRPPEVVLKSPGRDLHASPLEEVWLAAEAWDDFGILSYGLTVMHGTEAPRSTTLGGKHVSKDKRQIEHTLFLEDERAQPDELLTYYFWADDTGPDGKPRRTSSDMFFVEVRPFEEIYRQGEQPTEGQARQGQAQQGGAAQRAGNLAELQKQIMNATWKLLRERDTTRTNRGKDIAVVRDSQSSAREQLQELSEQVASEGAEEVIEQIDRDMGAAIEKLGEVSGPSSTESLQLAFKSETAAYQGLLKLRAREHNVVRGQMAQAGGASGSNRSERQLSELELDPRENRYESRRAPNSAQQQAAREDNQVLNRLRELARRQEDLNKRMQELQSALQSTRDEEERRELQRQLERLRDEQQEMLRDLDELRDRMNQPENQQRMAQSREQLEQTRQNLRQAAESLRQERLAPALNSGTRAERELEEARDDFRRRTANQFAEDMKNMREDARELAQRENDLNQQLDQMTNSARQSLRDEERDKVVEQIGNQRQRLSELTNDMKDVSEAAETAEPLLSRQLYDTLRDTTQRNIDRSMDLTSQLLRRGFLPEASKSEQSVRQDIDRVRAGVERAARSVLGDPAEATRRALDEVQDLTRQVQEEVDRADPNSRPSEDQQLSNDLSQQQQQQESGSPGRESQAPSQSNQQQRRASSPQQRQQGGDSSNSRQPTPGQESSQANSGRSSSAEQRQQGSDSSNPQRPAPGQEPSEPNSGRDSQSSSTGSRNATSNQPQPPGGNDGGRQNGEPRGEQRNVGPRSGPNGNVDIAGWTGPGGPITGEEFRRWSDRLREVEEMLENPDLRAEVAEINDRAREIRRDLKRHSKEPNWSDVRLLIEEPLVILQAKLREELARQESNDPLVPIDRDPVPPKYHRSVQEYYERLGSGK
jgi:hypothetical protein